MSTTVNNWQKWAIQAQGDLEDMNALVDEICRARTVTLDQLEAAKEAQCALRTALNTKSAIVLDVARLRYEKLIACLGKRHHHA